MTVDISSTRTPLSPQNLGKTDHGHPRFQRHLICAAVSLLLGVLLACQVALAQRQHPDCDENDPSSGSETGTLPDGRPCHCLYNDAEWVYEPGGVCHLGDGSEGSNDGSDTNTGNTAAATNTDDSGTNVGGGGGSGGSGGGSNVDSTPPTDQHGDTPETATAVSLSPQTPCTPIRGDLVSRTDVDYFRLDVPHPGLLRVETTGATNTSGTLSLADVAEPLASDDNSGTGNNFRLGHAILPGTYYVAVWGSGGATGAYTLRVCFSAGYFENPGAGSSQSGIGVLSGWVCDAEEVRFEFVRPDGSVWREPAASGTIRTDTAPICGHSATGFGLLWNWNLLGAGAHTVRAVVDDIVLAEHTFTVTTLGIADEQGDEDDFPRGLSGRYPLADFPTAGETTTLEWSQAQQNFVITPAQRAAGRAEPVGEPGDPTQAMLENPAPGSYQSGIGVISGWACGAEEVDIELEHGTTGETLILMAGYGTSRPDALDICGDMDNGFGLLWNWNILGPGEHIVRAFADGEEIGWSKVTVTTLGEEFRRGLRGMYELEDFPTPGETVTVEWQQAQQNFVITGREQREEE